MSQFYDQASLVMIPSGYKAGKVYSQKPLSTDGELTFTRNSNATRIGPDGKLEKVRENLCLNSQNQLASNWLSPSYPTTGIVTASTTVDPFGGTNAFKLAYGTGAQLATIVTATAGTTYTTSVWVRRVTGSTKFKFFDTNNSATIFDIDGTWQRFFVTSTANSITGRLYLQVFDSSSEIEVFGAQFEVSDFGPTQYIPTTSAAVSVGPTANVPRLNYSNGCPSLLLEPQRTNSITNSEQFNNAAWLKTASGTGVAPAITANYATSPSGYQDADLVVFDRGAGNSSSDFSWIYHNFLTSAATYTVSCYVKAATAADVGKKLAWRNFGGGTAWDVSLTNEWQRIQVQAIGGGVNQEVGFYNRGGYTTDNSVSVLMWGFQAEVGAYASSYIPTLGASVTRLADDSYLLQTPTDADTFTYFFEVEAPDFASGGGELLLENAASSSQVRVYLNNASTGLLRLRTDNPAYNYDHTYASLGIAVGDTLKIALSINNGVMKGFINGALETTAVAATIAFGRIHYRPNANIVLKQALYFDSALSDADCENLTAL